MSTPALLEPQEADNQANSNSRMVLTLPRALTERSCEDTTNASSTVNQGSRSGNTLYQPRPGMADGTSLPNYVVLEPPDDQSATRADTLRPRSPTISPNTREAPPANGRQAGPQHSVLDSGPYRIVNPSIASSALDLLERATIDTARTLDLERGARTLQEIDVRSRRMEHRTAILHLVMTALGMTLMLMMGGIKLYQMIESPVSNSQGGGGGGI